jgi:hypothetical protein
MSSETFLAGVVLLAFGLPMLVVPSVPLAVERRRRARQTGERPSEVEFSDSFVFQQRVVGGITSALGLLLLLGS